MHRGGLTSPSVLLAIGLLALLNPACVDGGTSDLRLGRGQESSSDGRGDEPAQPPGGSSPGAPCPDVFEEELASPDADYVSLEIEFSQPRPSAVVRNNGSDPITYSGFLILQQRSEGGWRSLAQINTSEGVGPSLILRCDEAYGFAEQTDSMQVPAEAQGPVELLELPPLGEREGFRLARTVRQGESQRIMTTELPAAELGEYSADR